MQIDDWEVQIRQASLWQASLFRNLLQIHLAEASEKGKIVKGSHETNTKKRHCHETVLTMCKVMSNIGHLSAFPFFSMIQCRAHFRSRVCDGALSGQTRKHRNWKRWRQMFGYGGLICWRPAPSSLFDSSACHCRKESLQPSTFRGCVPWVGFAAEEIVKRSEFWHKQQTLKY